MPEVIRFVVTETRSVDVTANSLADAILIADVAFKEGQMKTSAAVPPGKLREGVWGNTSPGIKQTSLIAERKQY